jgi:single-strand DNA-binding protein
MNKVILEGCLTRDPELKTAQNNRQCCKFSIATNEHWLDKKTGEWQKETEYHDIFLWGPSAERTASRAKKGLHALVEGKIKSRKYENKAGVEVKVVEIEASSVTVFGGEQAKAPAPSAKFVAPPMPTAEEYPADDLPF